MILRHEIPMNQTGTLVGAYLNRVVLDTTKYNGSCTFYLELFHASSAEGTYTLRRLGTSTDDLVFSVSSVNYYRTPAFTPPTGSTEYELVLSGTTSSSRGFKIVVVQDTTSLTALQTEISFSSAARYSATNTTAEQIGTAHYWKYTAAEYDGTLTFWAEASFASSGSMYGVTIRLQEDDGAFSNWTDKVTIHNASTATISRARVNFTPTDGRHYRVVSFISNNMENYTVQSPKIGIEQTGIITKFTTANHINVSTSQFQSLTYFGTDQWSGVNRAYRYEGLCASTVNANLENPDQTTTYAALTNIATRQVADISAPPTTEERVRGSIPSPGGTSRILIDVTVTGAPAGLPFFMQRELLTGGMQDMGGLT